MISKVNSTTTQVNDARRGTTTSAANAAQFDEILKNKTSGESRGASATGESKFEKVAGLPLPFPKEGGGTGVDTGDSKAAKVGVIPVPFPKV